MDIRTLCLDFDKSVSIEGGYRFPFNVYNSLSVVTSLGIVNYLYGTGKFGALYAYTYYRPSGTIVLGAATAAGMIVLYVAIDTPEVVLTVDPDV